VIPARNFGNDSLVSFWQKREMTSYLKRATTIAKKAGELQIQKLGTAHKVEFKGEINIVTEVDKACEQLIVDYLHAEFPDHDILSEEGSGSRQHSDYKWIIDPLDGTTNYAHAYPFFAVSIALEHCGEIILGVVYEPNRNEMFTAEKGKGSFLNDLPISVSKTKILIESLLVTGFAYNFKKSTRANLEHFKNMLFAAQAVRRDGAAAIDLCYVACGRYDGFWEQNLFPWDVAAGMLIVKEAGGQITDFVSKDFSIYGKELLASNRLLHPFLLEVLQNSATITS